MNAVHYAVWIFLIFLPAGIANMTPVIANKIPLLNQWKTPLDFGKSYKGKRVFGTNKTWRGLVTGAVIAGLTAVFIQWLFIDRFAIANSLSTGFSWQSFAFGAWIGTGALIGDAVESFFKRQKGVPSGESWFPFDQTDYIIGGLLFGLPFLQLNLLDYVAIFVMYFGLHLFVSYIGYLLNFKDKPI